ncbi:ZYRO0G06974p [Zygosaccharomyces rouxii]|uniref:Required for respiratory growth protein 1, mitochondrial n=1 Tax=Zygosaccharomyces rouxii (strain ATCC 2623 / CBS 732 / NBRC 1130 / NCYC 568 / NRRL Y-229) TaxID=559307 RepID=RRG1_ZYGRC|nr:uncharacterized protein ZYRO0G06974g [Zygosaccharomyces rouxii]C5DZT2.1 RecName: Full=Required for respiratory growth protein 1, mitochondrial [Zygosaccharomyces rouxii CBS 732]KAH9202363.1 required for respiratory growth protein 1, mitochondrial [Zygosaccharomyces rouxii]CAR29366.1 ZYRO0G06974p [Zygosaccharomyces rouxii]
MVQNFIHLPEHRQCVLHLYRHTLRNSKQCCHSQHLINRIKKITRQTIVKHRYDKSSWSVHFYLQKLYELNHLLIQRDVKTVWNLLTDVSKSKSKSKSKKSSTRSSRILKALQDIHQLKQDKGLQDPQIVREKLILNNYIKREQARNHLPRFIPEEYKTKLLLPLALHTVAMARLNSIHGKLVEGPPKVFLTHTTPMGHRIWFVRSAFNKKKRQSKTLGILIRREKNEGHKRWDYLRQCKSNAYWAQQEANWEQLIENKIVPQFDLNRYLDSQSIGKKKIECPPQLAHWLEPIGYSIQKLNQINADKAAYFRNYKNRVLLNGGQALYFENKSITMYQRRVKRFQQMVQNDLPYVVPFFPGRDLLSTLTKYRF